MNEFIHDKVKKQFILKLADGLEARVDYLLDEHTMHLIHSEVPYKLRGQKIGQELVEKTFEKLNDEGYQAIAVCSYIRVIAQRSPKWSQIIN